MTYCCLMPRRLLVGDTTPMDRVIMVLFRESNLWSPALTDVCTSLFDRRRFDEFSGEGSAARQSLVHQYDVPEEFIGVLICDPWFSFRDIIFKGGS
ncbi:hypothetical protein EVAR_41047_1 [Eumeta japonica]|uniref:Uncharacterized protein n=1 Tax=Eumeta variegata TaxID=151549 RepID=A0A4C1XTD0_EUMVA|nr:hypothetical protein EVAR_41047_1 [Eumeta japonica]